MHFPRFFVSNVRIRASALLFSSISLLKLTFPMQICGRQPRRREKTGVPFSGRRFSLSKNLVEFAPAGAKKVQSFSSATCAAKKILLRLQVWNLYAGGAQMMRAADCNPLVKK